MEESYLWKSGIAQYEMRLLLEGALVLYEDGASTLLRLAMKNEQYEAAGADEVVFEYEHGDAKVKQNLHTSVESILG